MRLLTRMAADITLIAHFGFVLFALFGAFLVLLDERWTLIHTPAVLWSSVVNLESWTCPLTPIERYWRRRAGHSYDGGFIQHYVGSLVYPQGMPRRLELIAGTSVLVWNILLYSALFAVLR
jgi:hypothetical protein